jgi:hypothetical protein
MMHMQHPSTGEVGGGDVEAMSIVLVHEANHQVYISTCLEEMFEDRIVLGMSMGDRGDQILYHVSSQGKLGEDNKVCFFLPGLFYVVEMFFEIGFDIPKLGGNLCKGKVEFHPSNLTTKQFALMV